MLMHVYIFVDMSESCKRSNGNECLKQILSKTIPKYLRELFIKRWNAKFPDQPWKSNIESGRVLYNVIQERNTKCKNSKQLKKLQYWKDEEWDISCFGYIMIDSGLKLYSQGDKDNMKLLKKIKSKLSSFGKSNPISSVESQVMLAKIKCTAAKMFGTEAEDEISAIANSQFVEEETGGPIINDFEQEVGCIGKQEYSGKNLIYSNI